VIKRKGGEKKVEHWGENIIKKKDQKKKSPAKGHPYHQKQGRVIGYGSHKAKFLNKKNPPGTAATKKKEGMAPVN